MSPDVLFKVARRWQELFLLLHNRNVTVNNNSNDNNQRSSEQRNEQGGGENEAVLHQQQHHQSQQQAQVPGGMHPQQLMQQNVQMPLGGQHGGHPLHPPGAPPMHPHHMVEGIQVELAMPSAPPPQSQPSLSNPAHAPPMHAYSFQVQYLLILYTTKVSNFYTVCVVFITMQTVHYLCSKFQLVQHFLCL